MRGRYFEEFSIGETLVTGRRTVDAGDVSRYAGLSGDFNPLHVDAEFAKTTPFGERVAHGILTLAVSHGQQNLGGWFEGTTLALLGLDRLAFPAPVRFGDTIRTEMIVKQTRPSSKPDRGLIVFDVAVKNQRDEAVCTYQETVLMRRKP